MGPLPSPSTHMPENFAVYDDDKAIGVDAPKLGDLEFLQGEKVELGEGKVCVVVFLTTYSKDNFPNMTELSELSKQYPNVAFTGCLLIRWAHARTPSPKRPSRTSSIIIKMIQSSAIPPPDPRTLPSPSPTTLPRSTRTSGRKTASRLRSTFRPLSLLARMARSCGARSLASTGLSRRASPVLVLYSRSSSRLRQRTSRWRRRATGRRSRA